MRHPLATLTVLLLAAGGLLSGCADDSSDAGATEPAASASSSPSVSPSAPSPSGPASPSASSSSPSPSRPSGTSIDIRLKSGKVTPNGARVKAKLDEPILLRIDADAAGELHVHSTPEQEVRFPQGTSTRRLTIDKPGIVDVEDHASDQIIVQLQVS